MNTYAFTIVLSNKSELSEDDAEKLFEAGCDDGAPGVSNETALIHFSRDADSLQTAIVSAKLNIEQAGFEIDHVELGSQDIVALEAS